MSEVHWSGSPGGRTWWAHDGAGRLFALLYWEDFVVGELDAPGGDPVVVDPGWLLIADGSPKVAEVVDKRPVLDDADKHRLLGVASEALTNRLSQ